MGKLLQLIVFAFVFATFITNGFCISCYQCNSLLDKDCVKVKNDTHLKLCDQSFGNRTYFCRKTTFTILDDQSSRVIRSCGWEVYKSNVSYCIQSDTDFRYQRSCQCFTDACNASSYLKQNLMVPLMSAIYLIYHAIL